MLDKLSIVRKFLKFSLGLKAKRIYGRTVNICISLGINRPAAKLFVDVGRYGFRKRDLNYPIQKTRTVYLAISQTRGLLYCLPSAFQSKVRSRIICLTNGSG